MGGNRWAEHIVSRAARPLKTGLPLTFTANYRVVLRKSEEGYSISCPSLPGCWSQGEIEKEPMANIEDAIREYAAAEELSRD